MAPKRKVAPAAEELSKLRRVRPRKTVAPSPSVNQDAHKTVVSRSPSVNQGASLEKLPDELLLQIFEHFIDSSIPTASLKLLSPNTSNTTLNTLYSVSLTSKRLHRVANQCLYGSFHNDLRCSSRFLRSLIATPELGTWVKNFVWYCPEGPPGDIEHGPTPDDCRYLRRSLRELRISAPHRTAWERDYASYAEIIDQLRLALIYTPNLRNLAVDLSKWSNMEPWLPKDLSTDSRICFLDFLHHAALGGAISNMPNFNQLHTFSLKMKSMQLDGILDIFHLPSLRVVALSSRGIHLSTDKVMPKWFSGVTDITIQCCGIKNEHVAMLIDSCRTLQELKIFYTPFRPWSENLPKMSYGQIARSLRHHKDSLQMLYMFFCQNWVDDEDTTQKAGEGNFDFHDFSELSYIHVPIEAFPTEGGIDLIDEYDTETRRSSFNIAKFLPRSLRCLQLFCLQNESQNRRGAYMLRDFKFWKAIMVALPFFRRIIIDFDNCEDMQKMKKSYLPIRAIFMRMGIRLIGTHVHNAIMELPTYEPDPRGPARQASRRYNLRSSPYESKDAEASFNNFKEIVDSILQVSEEVDDNDDADKDALFGRVENRLQDDPELRSLFGSVKRLLQIDEPEPESQEEDAQHEGLSQQLHQQLLALPYIP